MGFVHRRAVEGHHQGDRQKTSGWAFPGVSEASLSAVEGL